LKKVKSLRGKKGSNRGKHQGAKPGVKGAIYKPPPEKGLPPPRENPRGVKRIRPLKRPPPLTKKGGKNPPFL